MRFRLRFGIRSLLILILLSGLVANWVNRAHRQEALVNEIKASGGWAGFHYEVDQWFGEQSHGHSESSTDYQWPSPHYWYNIDLIELNGLKEIPTELWKKIVNQQDVRHFSAAGVKDFRLEKIAHWKSLKTLNISRTQIKDLSGLEKFKQLERLYFSGCQVSDISAIADLKQLKTLAFNETHVTDLTPLRNLANLNTIHAQAGNIQDLSPLATLSNLEMADFTSNNISDVSVFRELPKLFFVGLSRNPISKIQPLSRHPSLTTLFVSGTKVRDLEPLRDVANLRWLTIDQTPVTNLAPLYALNLREFEYTAASFSQAQQQELRRKMNGACKIVGKDNF